MSSVRKALGCAVSLPLLGFVGFVAFLTFAFQSPPGLHEGKIPGWVPTRYNRLADVGEVSSTAPTLGRYLRFVASQGAPKGERLVAVDDLSGPVPDAWIALNPEAKGLLFMVYDRVPDHKPLAPLIHRWQPKAVGSERALHSRFVPETPVTVTLDLEASTPDGALLGAPAGTATFELLEVPRTAPVPAATVAAVSSVLAPLRTPTTSVRDLRDVLDGLPRALAQTECDGPHPAPRHLAAMVQAAWAQVPEADRDDLDVVEPLRQELLRQLDAALSGP